MQLPVLKVEKRQDTGKAASIRIRRDGRIPATCYGLKGQALSLEVVSEELIKIVRGPLGWNSLIELDGAEGKAVFVQEIQRHPVTRLVLHVDFLHVDITKPVRRQLTLDFQGKPEGFKFGGMLEVMRRNVLVECLPNQIPEKIVVDVSPLNVGQSVHVAELKLPEGVKVLFEQNFSICAVTIPAEEKPTAAEAEAAEIAVSVEGAAASATTDGKKTEAAAGGKAPDKGGKAPDKGGKAPDKGGKAPDKK